MREISFLKLFRIGGLPAVVLLLYPIINIFIFDNQANTVLSTRGFLRLFYIAVISITVIYFIRKSYYRFSIAALRQSSLKYFLLYLIFSGLSFLWSTENTAEILFRFIDALSLFLLIVIVITYIITKYNSYIALKWIFLFATIFIFSKTLTFAIIRNDFSLISISNSSQFFSTIFFYLALKYSRWIIKIIISLLAIFSTSTIGYIGMVLALFAFGIGKFSNKFVLIFTILAISISSLIMGGDNLLRKTIFFDKENISYETSSGRNTIYNSTIKAILDKPILGYGYIVGERKALLKYSGRFYDTSHNGFLSALLGTGLIGFILLTTYVYKSLFEVFKIKRNRELKSYLLASTIIAIVHTLGNPGIGSKVVGAWVPTILLQTFIAINFISQKYEKNTLG